MGIPFPVSFFPVPVELIPFSQQKKEQISVPILPLQDPLPKAWIDIGKSEKTAGVSYVAISRVKSLTSCIIEPMTYERLTSLKSLGNLQYRLEEENRLDQLAQTTSSVFRATNHLV